MLLKRALDNAQGTQSPSDSESEGEDSGVTRSLEESISDLNEAINRGFREEMEQSALPGHTTFRYITELSDDEQDDEYIKVPKRSLWFVGTFVATSFLAFGLMYFIGVN